MGRGTELAEGVALTDTSPQGVTTTVHFRGETMVIQRTQDMADALEYVRQRREELEGQNWGTGREVGYVPELFYSQICAATLDPDERRKACKRFLMDNPAFCYFPKYLRGGRV